MRTLISGLVAALVAASPAFAGFAAGAPPSPLTGLLPLVFIFVVFYFLLIRPQRKRMQAHDAMIKAVKKGDNIVSTGGILGKVTKVVDDSIVMVEIAPTVEVKMARSMISSVLDKDGKPVVASVASAGKNDNVTASSKSVANDN